MIVIKVDMQKALKSLNLPFLSIFYSCFSILLAGYFTIYLNSQLRSEISQKRKFTEPKLANFTCLRLCF